MTSFSTTAADGEKKDFAAIFFVDTWQQAKTLTKGQKRMRKKYILFFTIFTSTHNNSPEISLRIFKTKTTPIPHNLRPLVFFFNSIETIIEDLLFRTFCSWEIYRLVTPLIFLFLLPNLQVINLVYYLLLLSVLFLFWYAKYFNSYFVKIFKE